jgi:hypothetical protein
MQGSYDRAFKEIARFVRALLPDAQVSLIQGENISIRDGGRSAVVHLGRSALDDFEQTLDNQRPVRYSRGIRNNVQNTLLAVWRQKA